MEPPFISFHFTSGYHDPRRGNDFDRRRQFLLAMGPMPWAGLAITAFSTNLLADFSYLCWQESMGNRTDAVILLLLSGIGMGIAFLLPITVHRVDAEKVAP